MSQPGLPLRGPPWNPFLKRFSPLFGPNRPTSAYPGIFGPKLSPLRKKIPKVNEREIKLRERIVRRPFRGSFCWDTWKIPNSLPISTNIPPHQILVKLILIFKVYLSKSKYKIYSPCKNSHKISRFHNLLAFISVYFIMDSLKICKYKNQVSKRMYLQIYGQRLKCKCKIQ